MPLISGTNSWLYQLWAGLSCLGGAQCLIWDFPEDNSGVPGPGHDSLGVS